MAGVCGFPVRSALLATALVAIAAEAGAASDSSRRAGTFAQRAGCVIKSFSDHGREHTTKPVTSYASNPPTSGPHNPEPAADGVYAAGSSPQVENWVHTLEHGRVLIQYRPGTPAAQVDKLESLFHERFRGRSGYHLLLFENTTKMPYAVAAVTWRRYLGCPTSNARVPDAIRAFRTAYVDHAPELIP